MAVIVVLIAAGLLCGAYWYRVVSNDHILDQDISNNTPKKEKEFTEETLQNKYLVIKEWGVKFRLSNSTQDAVYKFKENGSNWVIITTSRLDELSLNNPACSGANESTTISRARVGDDRFGSPWSEQDLRNIGVKVEDYYYFTEGGQPCFDTDENLASVVEEIGLIRAELSKISETVVKQ